MEIWSRVIPYVLMIGIVLIAADTVFADQSNKYEPHLKFCSQKIDGRCDQ